MSQRFVKLKELSSHSCNIRLFEVDMFWLDIYQIRGDDSERDNLQQGEPLQMLIARASDQSVARNL